MIFLGPGGTAGLGYEEGLKTISKLDLTALEVEFTYGVRMTAKEAIAIAQLARELKIRLSVHGPYYINLASKEEQKVWASRERILKSCERANDLGATHVVFHAGFYQGREKKDIYEMIKQEIISLQEEVKANGWKTSLAPELTGKATQFGDIDELIALKKETGCNFTIDFAHNIARSAGKRNHEDIFDALKKNNIKGHLHSHFSGIEYTDKGERKHNITTEEAISSLLKEALKNNADLTIINESPDPLGDSIKALKILNKLKSSKI